jgi:hypothetical protein
MRSSFKVSFVVAATFASALAVAQHQKPAQEAQEPNTAAVHSQSVTIRLPPEIEKVYLRSSPSYSDNLVCELRNADRATLLKGECGGQGWCTIKVSKGTGTCTTDETDRYILCSHLQCETSPTPKAAPKKSVETKKPQSEKLQKLFALEDSVTLLDFKQMNTEQAEKYSRPGAQLPRQRDKATSQGYCYRGVKISLRQSGLAKNYISGASAKDAGPALIAEGFKKLTTIDPEAAPPGAVIVYSNTSAGIRDGGKKHGHIEIKTDRDTYFSDYKTGLPITSSANGAWYEVSGIYFKEE